MIDVHSLSEARRFELLVSAVTDYAIYMLDPSGVITTWNPGARRFKGYEAGEIIGHNFSRFFSPEDQAEGRPAAILGTAADEGRFEGEGWRVRKDGSRFLAHVVVDAIRDDDGALIGFAKITRDVTERHMRDRALFESEQRFRMLVQGVRDYAIYMLDQDGRITNWNSGAETIKGYTADEIVGEHFSRFYTDEDRAAGEPQRALKTALTEGTYEREAWRVRKDGSLFWANVVIDPIFDEFGEHIGFAKVTRDATERKRAQEELEEARAELAQSQRLQALGELTGGIAHDFNNLMTVIAGSADFLLRRPKLDPEKRRQYLEAITQTADRATTLTNHLLAFGRRQAIKPEVIPLNIRLDALSELLARTLGSQIEVKLELAPDLGNVEADATHLETAILNAALNARDAMPNGGQLTLRTSVEPGEGDGLIRLEIVDTGEGMPSAVIDRAFEPFFTTKEVGKGTGLGLSQIHGFAAQAGGRAEIRSREGEGTTISILLPRTFKEPADAEVEHSSAAIPPKLRVLLVEDNAQVRVFAEDLLTDLGCKVRSVEDGADALEALRDAPVDLVLTDVVMPGMSGIELARRVKEDWPDVPILLATGYSEEVVSGAAQFPVITKPYGLKELTAMIERVVRERDERAA